MPPPDLSKHIEKVLDVGTVHITASDNGLLHGNVGDNDDFPVTILEYNYGYLISSWHYGDVLEPEEIEQFEKDFLEVGFSRHLLDLIKLACGAGCTWLQLDRDGETVAGLPVFEW